jgi:serine/threonine protein kinase
VSTRFGRYDLLRPIGKGGMAEVFLARYVGPEGFEKQLVIKRVLPRISESPHLLRMFFEEAKTQVSFSHGNLVSVFDFGRVDNDHFIAMDYVRGADLASLFAADRGADQRLAPSLLAHVGVEICRGLAYVHGRGFVHRDVTPRNVLLSVDGEVKLSDFGLALAMQSPFAPGRPGTRSYMAPEQARGDRVDARADLYSLGLILTEGLLGRNPQAAADGAGSVEADILAEVATHGALGGILARAVAPSPEQRFAGATEMLAALEAEIGRIGAGREALVRELAAKVHRLAPGEETFASGAPRVATVPTAVDAEPTRESYFRDHRSAAFVESMFEASPPQASSPKRAGAIRWAAAVAGGAALIAAAVFVLRGGRGGEAAPPPTSVGIAPASPAGAPSPAAPIAAPAPAAPPSPAPPTPSAPPAQRPEASVAVAEAAAAPTQRPARRPPRAPSPQPSPPPSQAAAASGQIRILCTPWCVPFVDGKAVGEDGRSFVVPVAPGRHKVEARRLDDRLQRQLDISAGQDESAHFDFDDGAR